MKEAVQKKQTNHDRQYTSHRSKKIQSQQLPLSKQALNWRRINVDATWSRRIDIDTTSFWSCVPAGVIALLNRIH